MNRPHFFTSTLLVLGVSACGAQPIDSDNERFRQAVSLDESSAMLWQGLDHDWLRTIDRGVLPEWMQGVVPGPDYLSFSVPHRLSVLDSFIADSSFSEDQVSGEADVSGRFGFGQSTGVDGNYMHPVGFATALQSNALRTATGVVELTGQDSLDESDYPFAIAPLSGMIRVDLAGMGLGRIDATHKVNAEVALAGVQFAAKCLSGIEGAPCNSNGIWPFDYRIEIEGCAQQGTILSCPVAARFGRAWTPYEARAPKFLGSKALNREMSYSLRVHYTVLAASEKKVRFGAPSTMETTRRLLDTQERPIAETVQLPPAGENSMAVTIVKGFGFELNGEYSPGEAHRGRYIGRININVQDTGYDRTSGELSRVANLQVSAPKTVIDTDVHAFLRTSTMQFVESSAYTDGFQVDGAICVNSTPDAPEFSAWKMCQAGTDYGSEQMRSTTDFER